MDEWKENKGTFTFKKWKRERVDEKLWWETCPPTMRSLCLLRSMFCFIATPTRHFVCNFMFVCGWEWDVTLSNPNSKSLFTLLLKKLVTLTFTTTLMRIIALLGGGGWIWDELTSNSIMWEHWMVWRFASSIYYIGWYWDLLHLLITSILSNDLKLVLNTQIKLGRIN